MSTLRCSRALGAARQWIWQATMRLLAAIWAASACGTTPVQGGVKDAAREAPSLLPGTAARPADIFIPNYAATRAACLDFAVTHTQQPSILDRANVCAGAAAERYEVAVKDMKFGAACEAAGLLLVPMVVEVFGTWGAKSAEAFQLITKACANKASETGVAAGAHIRRRLSVTLQRLNARILLARVDP